MTKHFTALLVILLVAAQLKAQMEPLAGYWKTWFISSGKEHRLPPPPSYKNEVAEVIAIQKNLDSAGRQEILYWNAGAPGYRWSEMITKLWQTDTAFRGILSGMLVGVATYDATIVAWETKYAYNRPRPFKADKRIKALAVDPQSPSYPCEHSVAAGVATTIIGHFFPAMKDSANKLAQRVMTSRIAAGTAFPSDTRAGFELGKKIAELEIEKTKGYSPQGGWDGKVPQQPGLWNGKFAMFPTAGKGKPVVLESASQYRPGPPPDFAKEMEELKKFKPTFRSNANAYYWASQSDDVLGRKLFEHNLHLNAPRAARIYAYAAVATYDGFIACWDAKYAYWGIRPDQYDTTFKPVLIHTPPFPGYPSGHAMVGGVLAELYSYFFPGEKAYFDKRAKDGAESRFQGGIHFRSDNEVGLTLGRKVGKAIVERAKRDGVD
ncbi:MAG: phosphatase PAP2 family protein [Chitinophagaceae bacterium]|nr:phosphatase PAP2 family protein [Chitinophagaceae bacterium]